MSDKPNEPLLETGESEAIEQSKDMFSRPSGFRVDAIKAVWEKAPDGPEPDTKMDWRSGIKVGPWKFGESRADVWDMGHKVAWYKVVDELKKVDGITRKEVLDEFNNVDNLGVEDPESNRDLGINSMRRNLRRLPEDHAEEIIFNRDDVLHTPKIYRAEVSAAEERMKQRVQELRMKKSTEEKPEMTTEKSKGERIIIWDTETTGLSPAKGDKLVDIAAVELIDGKPTGREFHEIINPLRPIPPVATKVHAIDDKAVKGKPTFPEIADKFLEFIGDSPIVAHNARFDVAFLNAELEAAGKPTVDKSRSIDSLKLAKTVLPGKEKYDLDSLADNLGVDRSSRSPHHGALICSKVLADVFVKLDALAKEQGIPLQETTSELRAAHKDDGFEEAARDQKVLNDAAIAARQKSSFSERIASERVDGKGIAR